MDASSSCCSSSSSSMGSPSRRRQRRQRRRELIRPFPGGSPGVVATSLSSSQISTNTTTNTTNTTTTTTPTATRVHTAKRRLRVWMQQTWRQRNIPTADFETKSISTTASHTEQQQQQQQWSTPTKRSVELQWQQQQPPHRTTTTATTNHYNYYNNNTQVSNVDEALQALTELYKFQDCFPVQEEAAAAHLEDWIPGDDDDETSRALLEELYPTNKKDSNWMTSIRSELLKREQNSGGGVVADDDDDDENLVILRFGSAMGQQEYRFAAFDQANFDFHSVDDSEESEPSPYSTDGTTTDEATNATDRASASERENETKTTEGKNKKDDDERSKATLSLSTPAGEPSSETGVSANNDNKDDDDEERIRIQNPTVTTTTTTTTTKPSTLPSSATSFSPNFEAFWQSAIEAPTPDTGTYPSIDSRSTYVMSPSVLSVEEEAEEAAVTTTTASDDENPSASLERIASGESETEFGDFREAPIDIVEEDEEEGATPEPHSHLHLQQPILEDIRDRVGGVTNANTSFESNDDDDDDDDKNASFESNESQNLHNTSFETAVVTNTTTTATTIHTGITPLKRNGTGRCSTPMTPGSCAVYSSSLQTPGSSPDVVLCSHQRQLFSSSEGTPVAGSTPVTRNIVQIYNNNNNAYDHHTLLSPSAIAAAEEARKGGRIMMMIPQGMESPERFQLGDIHNVLNGIEDKNTSDGQNDHHDDGDDDEEEESSHPTYDGSLQSSSIPSVVQLFTKSVEPQQPKTTLVVPDTVRATNRSNRNNNNNHDAAAAASTAAAAAHGLSMPTFYLGLNSSLYSSNYMNNNSRSYYSNNADTHYSSTTTSAGILSMKRIMGMTATADEDMPSISSSIASPEVKFLRRHRKSSRSLASASLEGDDHHHNDSDDSDEFNDEESLSLGSLSTMPRQYWNHPELDHTLQELTKLEWDWLPYWQMDRLLDDLDDETMPTTDNIPLLQDQITEQLSKLDSFYGKICKKVYKKIQPHAEELLSANQAALDLQKNLTLSQMYLTKSQKSIELAKYGRVLPENENTNDDDYEGLGVHGAVRLLELWDIQQSYQELNGIERTISSIIELERTIEQSIAQFDTYHSDSLEECDSILGLVRDLQERLDQEPAKRLSLFDDARTRMLGFVAETFVPRLHHCLSEIAVEWCRCDYDDDVDVDSSRFLAVSNGEAYSRVLQVLLRVEGSSSSLESRSQLIENICTTIQTSLMMETQKAFGRALLDPTDSEHEESEYEQELVALSSNEAYLDSTRLPIWTHNLVTIRFDFEMKQGNKHPLPAVFHRLCVLLTDILSGAHRLIDWHNDGNDACDVPNDIRSELHKQLQSRRASIWNACTQSIEECLDEYTKFSGKKTLFLRTETGEHNDSQWREDLEGLHDVSILSNQFLSLSKEFLEGVPEQVVNDGSMIEDKLLACYKTHLRSFHVEAMNTLGNMFYREDWQLYNLQDLQQPSSSLNEETDQPLRPILDCISGQMDHQKSNESGVCCRSQWNSFHTQSQSNTSLGGLLSQARNPFDIDREAMTRDVSETIKVTNAGISLFAHKDDNAIRSLLSMLENYIGEDAESSSRLMLKSVFDGILPWTGRLLLIFDKLPFLRKDASNVMIGIMDLYVTTALRLCSGNAANERVLLDSFPQTTAVTQRPVAINRSSSNQTMFDFGLRSNPGQNHPRPITAVISPTAEAELCALVQGEREDLDSLRDFVKDAKQRMEGVAKLDLVDKWIIDPVLREDTDVDDFAEATARILEKRQAASCNYLFVGLGVFLVNESLSGNCQPIQDYCDRLLQVIPLLVTLCNRIACMRSIRGKALLREIVSVGSVWEESKLHEQANEYVEDFCDFLALLWRYLYSCPRPLPHGTRKTLWENLLGGGYMVLLDGFSRVPSCSTEGRALMSMDVASYRSGTTSSSIASRLEESHHPKSPLPGNIQAYRTMAYVDTYIKLFYFPTEDAIDWVRENYQNYHRHHILALVAKDRDAKTLSNRVIELYHRGGGTSETKAEMVRL